MRYNILSILILLVSAFLPSVSTAQNVILKVDTVNIACNASDTFLVPVKVSNFTNVAGMQFSINWNAANLDYAYITQITPAFASIGFDTSAANVNQGRFTVSTTQIGGVSMTNGATLFAIAFRRIGGPTTAVSITDIPTPVVFLNALGDDMPFTLAQGAVQPTDTQVPVITCPANVSVSGPGSATVNGIAPLSATDNCGTPTVGWSSTGATTTNFPNDGDASGFAFAVGQTTVVYTASDVGANTATCSFTINVELNNFSDSLTLIAGGATVGCNEPFSVNITTLNFDSIGGLQFSLNWNPGLIQYVSFSNVNAALSLNASNFGATTAGNGIFTFAWTTATPAGITLPSGATLFTLNFNSISTSPATVAFGNTPTPIVAFSSETFPPEETGVVTINGAIVSADLVAPILTCPASVTVDAPNGEITATLNNLQPTALSDNCTALPSVTHVSTGATIGQGAGNANGIFNAGTTNVVYTALDNAGNTSTCSFNVVVTASSALTLLIDTIVVDCQGGSQTQVTFNVNVRNFSSIIGLQFAIEWNPDVLQFASWSNPYPGLNLNASMFNTSIDSLLIFFGGNPSGWPVIPNGDTFFSITFNVLTPGASTDLLFQGPFNAANTSFQPVAVVTQNGGFSSSADFSAPVLTCPPTQMAVAPIGTCEAIVEFLDATAADACSGLQSIVSSKSDSLYLVGNTTVTYTATDNAGNSATCVVSVIVTGSNPPMITCPANISLDAPSDACGAIATWTDPAITNSCNLAGSSIAAVPPSGSTFALGVTQVTYTATDPIGLTATCQFTVEVFDTTKPIIICQNDVTISPTGLNCYAILNFDVPTATDFCDSEVEVEIDGAPASDQFPVGTTIVMGTAFDDFGNAAQCSFSVTVTDALAPVLSACPSDVTVAVPDATCAADVTWTGAPIATDNCDTEVTINVSHLSGSTFDVGETIVTYYAEDDAGNSASCTFLVMVTETVAPEFTVCPLDKIIFLPDNKCDTMVTWVNVLATDNCLLDTIIGNTLSGASFPTGDSTVVFIATDASGNTATCEFTITVRDEISPVFGSCPPSVTMTSNDGCPVVLNWILPTATDNCSVPTVSSAIPTDFAFPVGTTNVLILAEDASNNYDTCGFTVTINGIPPGFSNIPANILVFACETIGGWTPPSPVGLCGGFTLVSNFLPTDTFKVGIYQIEYTATPSVGNPIVTMFTLEVRDTVKPVINCPQGNIILNSGGGVIANPSNFVLTADPTSNCDSLKLTFNLPPATDNCDNAPVVTQQTGLISGSIFTMGSNPLTFRVTDASGNTRECATSIEIRGLAAVTASVDPPVACEGEIVVLTADSIPGATYVWTGPVSSDKRSFPIQGVTAATAGTYTVVASINGCKTPADTVQVLMATEPKAVDDLSFVLDPGTTDTFDVFDNDMLSPRFDFDVTDLTNLPTGVKYLGDGKFEIVGSIRNISFFYKVCSKSCPELCDMATVTILAKDSDCSFVPNIFTPNGDSDNQTLVIPCLDSGNFRENSIVIYNQWGDRVYEAKPYSNTTGWDGTLNGQAGQDLPDGTYFYIFSPGPNEKIVKGFVEIFR